MELSGWRLPLDKITVECPKVARYLGLSAEATAAPGAALRHPSFPKSLQICTACRI
jgi:hypothetical protein